MRNDDQEREQHQPSSVDRVNNLLRLRSFQKGLRAGKRVAKIGEKASGKAVKQGARVATRAAAQAVRQGAIFLLTNPIGWIIIGIIFIIVMFMIIITSITAGSETGIGTPIDCNSFSGASCVSTTNSCSSGTVADTSGAYVCSDSTSPVCCIPVGTVIPQGVFKPPFACGKTYGSRTYPGHSSHAIDFNRTNDLGDPVLASANGTVTYYNPSYGWVDISHDGGYMTRYVHMKNISARVVGQKVSLGQQIGTIGDVHPTIDIGPHLHFSLFYNNRAVPIVFDGVVLNLSIPDFDPLPVNFNVVYYGENVTGWCP